MAGKNVKLVVNHNNISSRYKEIIQKYETLFSKEHSVTKNYECEIRLTTYFECKIEPVRMVPFAWMDSLKQELDRMEEEKVIKQEDVPTEFVNSRVTVRKLDKKVTLGPNPKHLNHCIMRTFGNKFNFPHLYCLQYL